MSTKVSLDYNRPGGVAALPPFHVYRDFFVEGVVFVEIADCEAFPLAFEARPQACTLAIPLALWNRIVAIGPLPPEGGPTP